MSALSMIRHNMTLIVILIALALLAFLLTDLFTGLGPTMAAPPDAGVVAGQSISWRDYEDRVNIATNQSGGGTSELVRGRMADQVWNAMVSEIIWDKELKSTGVEVTGEELYDMFAGQEISPIVRNYILPPGQPYDQNAMKRQLEQIMENPDLAPQLKQLEDYAARSRGIERYFSIMKAGYPGSLAAAKQKNIEENRKVSLSFLSVPYAAIDDSTVSVSESEMRAYINAHKNEYKQEKETLIRFVKFEVRPSARDSSKAYLDIIKRKQVFAETVNDSVFTSNKTRTPYTENLQEISDIAEGIRDSVVSASEKSVFGPLFSGSYYKIYKLVKTGTAEEASAKVSHILITPAGTTAADSADARSKAAGLVSQANSGNFATLATENSQDFASRNNGGSLGWYRKGQFGEDFDKAVEAASVGSVIGPVKGQRGYHVIQVLDKTSKTFSVADIEEEISYTTPTRDSVYRAANIFANKVEQLGDINQAATESGYIAFESNPLTETTLDIQGLNGGRELVIWAINSDKGAKSKVLRVNDDYVFAQVTNKLEEGVKDLELVREEVELKVRNEKKAKLIKDKLASIGGQDLNAMKTAYGAGATVNSAENISFESYSIPGIGADKLIIGKVSGMDPGEVSKPIAGDNGVYVLQVTGVTEAPELDEATLANTKATNAAIQQQSLQNKAEPALIDLAKVKDTRAKAEAVLRYGIR
ncbi:MAG: peptidylprolyl isomerase [Bacteroidia bacterium]|nr:peptidylprolyl isomerase [Bacteroidia bacterium]